MINIQYLGKQYRIARAQESYRTLRDSLASAIAAPWHRMRSALQGQPIMSNNTDTIWALRGLSLQVRQGEVLGVIGRNGSGKTTLLKILSRVTEPTEGRAEISGRVGSLLEVGTGFHEELSGRENIILYGAILGMGRREIQRKFSEIVEFADVNRFIDTPIKRYSTGMKVRLAFSVAAHLDPQILLVDEVLSVGDVTFQQKCLGHIQSVAGAGRTVVFVSHNIGAVRGLCTRCIWLDGGEVVLDGSPVEVIEKYLESTVDRAVEGPVSLAERTDREGDGRVRITSFMAHLADGSDYDLPRTGKDMELVVGYGSSSGDLVSNLSVSIDIKNGQGQPIASLGNRYDGSRLIDLPPHGQLVCRIPYLPLQPGQYYVTLSFSSGGPLCDKIRDAVVFEVGDGDFFGTNSLPPKSAGDLLVPHRWTCIGPDDVVANSYQLPNRNVIS